MLFIALECNGQSVVVGKFAGLQRAQADLHASRDAVEGTHLPFNALGNIRGDGLSRAAQADKDEHDNRAPQKHH